MDTIFALSTLFGRSGIAVIRISGSDSLKTKKIFSIQNKLEHRVSKLCKLFSTDGSMLDQALVIYFQSPNSFTGEDVIELHLHGSIAVINEATNHLKRHFRIAEPGEFTRRAFENSKIDLLECEGLIDLLNAETTVQLKQAVYHHSGQASKAYAEWRKQLINILALIESNLDFPEEDIPTETLALVLSQIQNLTESMRDSLEKYCKVHAIRDGIKISILGAPNTGKSSLFNAIIQRDSAIVSDIPGTTRDIIEKFLQIKGFPVYLYDTAGIRKTLEPIEQMGVLRAKQQAEESNIVIAVSSTDNSMIDINHYRNNNIHIIKVINKIDLAEPLCDDSYLPISIKNNIGIDSLIDRITSIINTEYIFQEPPIITRERHKQLIFQASLHLKESTKNIHTVEIFAENIRQTLNKISGILGNITVDDILNEIFSSFCIGK
ncbi:MAG: tRNA modification GTPase TrmE [Candidatus Xenolissoclinum pacificiensis L6]|uniref:tRNA modification GTPase MnmE n=1 Tax=Candidatus Xenolissoclinum pacificiensis L6 TaxID=1401685 RepID=W2V0D8_9RICK|nr:MAG: tRNA modification GTPase TrmE [Candidatus Xenolissoclinum pacificiensis L6]